jgi:hypothetical protein
MFCMYSARKKNIASIAKLTMNAVTFAPRNDLERKKLKSTIGYRDRCSICTKATSATTAVAISPRIRAEPQPQELASTSASTSAARPTVIAATPGMSTDAGAVSSRDSCVANNVTTTAPAATGRLRKKIDCHETLSTRKPPTTGPMASASALTPAQVPIALPRSSGGNALEMIESVPGIMNAAPMPWTARPPTSQASLCEKPMKPLDSAKVTTPKRNIRRRTNRSPRRPPVTSSTANASVYAFTVHSRPETVAPRSSWIDGSATFTTVLSSMIMNSAKHMAASVHQRRFPSWRRRRAVIWGPCMGGRAARP